MKVESIATQIEQKREEMYNLAKQYGISDAHVLSKSREIDRMLNRYQRLISYNSSLHCG